MTKNLIIVESPSKCKKVEKAAGPGYVCLSSCGHIYQLIHGLSAIDFSNQFEPKYELMKDKKKVVSQLKKGLKTYNNIYLASDPDREGEAIAVHLAEELNIKNSAKRITFNEITSTAIKKALKQPRQIDFNLYDAQKARRVLDRLMGFEISPLLWKYLPNNGNLSAGRCQSPALQLIYQRERDIQAFQPKSFYDIHGTLDHKKKNISLKIKYPKKLDKEKDVIQLLNHCLLAQFTIFKKDIRLSESKPPAPFTTSTLQQEASLKLGYNPKRTMQIAQKLYENAYITYMRTDSTTMSEDAKKALKSYIQDKYGNDYHKSRNYNNQSKNAQEAHECVRITDVELDSDMLDGDQKKLYELILKRTLASQMTNKITKICDLDIHASNNNKDLLFKAQEEEIEFDGYSILYPKKDSVIRPFKVGELLNLNKIEASPELEKPKPRYTEASLVKALEKSGIGRPSTFSNIISTLMDREYIILGKSSNETIQKTVLFIKKDSDNILEKNIDQKKDNLKGKLIITDLGIKVLTFLNEHFAHLLDDKYTNIIENELDKVSQGNVIWHKVVEQFYNGFHPQVKRLTSTASSNDNTRVKNNKEVKSFGTLDDFTYSIVKTRYGNTFVQKSNTNDKDIRYLPIVQSIYNKGISVTIDQLDFLFSLPLDCGNNIKLYYGRNGFYAKQGAQSVNLEGSYDLEHLPDNDDIIQKLNNKPTSKLIKEYKDYKIMEGKYGPYIIHKSKFYKIPKKNDPSKLTLTDCKKIISDSKK